MTRTKISLAIALLVTAFAFGGLKKSANQPTGLFLAGDVISESTAESIAIEHLNNHSRALDGVQEFYTKKITIDQLGMAHARFQQVHDGIPVFGAEVIVHLDKNGNLARMTDSFDRSLRVDTNPKLGADDAIRIAVSTHGNRDLKEEPQADLFILRHNQADHLVYRVQIRDFSGKLPAMPVMFVSATTGEIINSYNNLKDARNRRTYTANNGTSLPGSLVRTEGSGPSGDSVLDEAHDNAGLTYDYFFNAHGRDSYDDNGATINSTVHFQNNYVNAFWNGSQMVYGDGDGVTADPLVSLDVVGHELTHAVTDFSSDLIYQNESGALNEAMSDVFAAAIEVYRDGSVSANTWKIGEEIWTPGTAGDALRYMNNPTQDGSSYDYYPERYVGSADNGGVHWNSGIANLAFYLLSEGGTHPRGKTSNVVGSIGINDAAAIFYRANNVYLTASSNFAAARTACINAATDLFGSSSNQVTQTGEAWTAVGVAAPPSYAVIDTQSGLSGSTGNQQTFGPYNASSYDAIRFDMSGGSGDADLYVRFGSAPTTSAYDCRPYLNGNNESCEFNPASSGNYYVMIRAYSTYSGVTLTVSAAGGSTPDPEVCNDGVDNDGDGDVDCADSDCNTDPACQTPDPEVCDDGVDNDGDGDVDCADSDCSTDPACQTSGWTTISSSDFESGWQGYTDGGSDCRRSANDSAYANSGTYCIRIRDNSGSVSSFFTTNTVNLSAYSQVRVQYSMYPRSMENGEDYFVEMWNGSSWVVVANYARGTDFENNTRYEDEIIVNTSSIGGGGNFALRFRNDASGNSDWVYIDDVVVSAQ